MDVTKIKKNVTKIKKNRNAEKTVNFMTALAGSLSIYHLNHIITTDAVKILLEKTKGCFYNFLCYRHFTISELQQTLAFQ